VLLLGCVGVLAIQAAHGVRTTNDQVRGRWHDDADHASAQLTCLAQQVDAGVPRHSRVSVDPALGTELWQRTLELVWARATPVPPGDPADISLVVGPGRSAQPCAGAVVVARPGPLPPTTPTAPSLELRDRG
jgi:hypothetical protein